MNGMKKTMNGLKKTKTTTDEVAAMSIYSAPPRSQRRRIDPEEPDEPVNKMVSVTFKIPINLVKEIDRIVRLSNGKYYSRSEFIREAVVRLLNEERKNIPEEELKKIVKNPMPVVRSFINWVSGYTKWTRALKRLLSEEQLQLLQQYRESLKCPLCGSRWDSKRSLKSHIVLKHSYSEICRFLEKYVEGLKC